MNSFEKFYKEKLYRFQDGVMRIINALNTPFYLTGGTALSRHYFNHRFSDDLDLFVNQNPHYSDFVQSIFESLQRNTASGKYSIDFDKLQKTEYSTQIFLKRTDEDIILKIDLINDVAPHFGQWEADPVLGRVDSWRNILSNKISALYRYEAKDYVDLWIIARNRTFNWREMIAEARKKEAGVDPIDIYEMLRSFPSDALDTIKWITPVNKSVFMEELDTIAHDIFTGDKNRLFRGKSTN